MMKKLCIVLLLIICASKLFAQSNSLYNSIFDKSQRIELSNNRINALFAKVISDKDDEIPVKMIDTITFEEKANIKNFGQVDIFRVKLKNNPSVLNPFFLVMVNHVKKQFQTINLDDYKLIKSKVTDTTSSLVALVNSRGMINLQFYKYNFDKLNEYQINNITVITDCKKVEVSSIKIINTDKNQDGWLDISITFQEANFCDEAGLENDKPTSQNQIVKVIPFIPSSKYWK